MPEVQEKELHGNRTKSKPTSPFDSGWLSKDDVDNIGSTYTDKNSDEDSEGLEVATQKPPKFRDVSEKVGASHVQSIAQIDIGPAMYPWLGLLTKQALDVSYYAANNIVGR
jgi:hypothetical protein